VGIQLVVQLITTAASMTLSHLATAGVEVNATELGHANDPAFIRTLNQPVLTNNQVFAGGQSAALTWQPPANPLRYWRVRITFTQTVAGPVTDTILTAACY
tara:strand:+ start:591 stop:893 length:303 start_codon:yes stop_codon:yes gene_type:complete